MPDAERSLWVGLVDACFDDGPDENGMIGAFVWAVCRADSADDFERRVTAELTSHSASSLALNDVEPLHDRMRRERVTRKMRRMVHDARSSDVAFGTWYRYPENDE